MRTIKLLVLAVAVTLQVMNLASGQGIDAQRKEAPNIGHLRATPAPQPASVITRLHDWLIRVHILPDAQRKE